MGREAVQKAKTVIELTDSGKDILSSGIAHLRPVENVPKTGYWIPGFLI